MQSARGFEYGVKHLIHSLSHFVGNSRTDTFERSSSDTWVEPLTHPIDQAENSARNLHYKQSSLLITDVLSQHLNFESTRTYELLNLGAIYLNHRRCLENLPVDEGAYLRVHTKPRRFPDNDGLWQQRIVFQNSDFIVANKISGLPVHASVDNIRENLLAYLEAEVGQKLFITHRLDVPTRGLIVYAKTQEFQKAFNKILTAREIKKIYRARITKPAPLGLLTHFMEVSPRAPKKVDFIHHPGWQECVLEILNQKQVSQDTYELYIQLHTGRTHQIRAQLGFIKCPILGDHTYGAEKISDDEKIELEACELEFINPITSEYHYFVI